MSLIVLIAALVFASPAPAGMPDLWPDFDPKTGVITINNASSRAVDVTTYVTVTCQRIVPLVSGGQSGCPSIPRAFVKSYTSRRAPGAVIFSIGYVAPGAMAKHQLAYWTHMVWPAGVYRIDINVDVGNKVFETDERNNLRAFSIRFPGQVMTPRRD